MATAEVQVTLPYKTGLPADVSVNTWYFTSADPIPTYGPDVRNALQAFYEAVGDEFWHPIINFDAVRIKFYAADQPPPRVPLADDVVDFDITNGANPRAPEEAAACLSFRSVYVSGSPPARHRGRIYLGPLSGDSFTTGTSDRTLLIGTLLDGVETAYNALRAGLPAGVSHAQHSDTDDAWRPVVAAWMDNAIDTQRRRGPDATGRLDFVLT